MSTINSQPASEYVSLFTFFLPDVTGPSLPSRGESYYYSSGSQDIDFQGDVYLSEPSLQYTVDKPLNGGVEPAEFEIQVRKKIEPLPRLTVPYPTGRIFVEVRELDPTDLSSIRTMLFGELVRGRSRRGERNPTIKVKCVSPKNLIQKASELSCFTTCSWRFGSQPCGFDLEANVVGINLLELNVESSPNRVRVVLASSPDLEPLRWRRGYLRNNTTGARVMVRNLISSVPGPNPELILDLSKLIPESWTTDDLSLVPGCDKQVASCRIHNREESFGGFGVAMPSYNPTFYSN